MRAAFLTSVNECVWPRHQQPELACSKCVGLPHNDSGDSDDDEACRQLEHDGASQPIDWVTGNWIASD